MIKIFHFDDNHSARNNVESYIIAINEDYQEKSISLRIQLESFESADLLEKKLLAVKREQNDTPQIIILDMYENNINVGERILKMIKELKLNISTIIFTQGSIDCNVIYYKELLAEFHFIIGEEINKGHPEKLKDRIMEIIEDKNPSYEKLFNTDKDDILLEAQIRSIGKQNLNKILRKVKEHLNYNQEIKIERMVSGFSGAIIFKLKCENKTYILKVSNNIKKLRNEYDRNKNYNNFPSIFRINIVKDFEIQDFYAILIENVHDADTFFNWLQNNNNQNNIEEFLKKLYLNSNSLVHFYENNRNSENVKFTHIFDIFQNKYAFVASAIKELKPLTDKYGVDFKKDDIKNLVLNYNYEKIDKNELIDIKYQKNKILCHGDFHANNIMVQANIDPIIIDTGGIKYDYWCMDICRLIVHLFIVGFYREKIQYYDITKIPCNFNIAKKIVALKKLDIDNINDGYIHAINWLIENVKNIYGDLYCKWEFQLGLCKELLQMSYRIDSIPPNKRTIALLAAYECMLQANNNVEI